MPLLDSSLFLLSAKCPVGKQLAANFPCRETRREVTGK